MTFARASRVKNISARGYTPITYILRKAAGDFPASFQGERIIILVSDGKETCEGDPCATAKAFANSKAKLVIHTIGFGVDEAARQQLECIVRMTGGKYFSAEDDQQLVQVLNRAIETSKTITIEKKVPDGLRFRGLI
jgi:Ca-activated chloride channel family protein